MDTLINPEPIEGVLFDNKLGLTILTSSIFAIHVGFYPDPAPFGPRIRDPRPGRGRDSFGTA